MQRALWGVMLLVILAALLGFLGTSPLATKLDEVRCAVLETGGQIRIIRRQLSS